jgi:hypothetical protein
MPFHPWTKSALWLHLAALPNELKKLTNVYIEINPVDFFI